MAKLKWLKTIIIAVATLFVLYYIVTKVNDAQWEKKRSGINQETYMSLSVVGNYDTVARYPDQQKGKMMYVSGSVGQVLENGNKVTLLLFDSAYNTWYITYRYAAGEGHLLVNDSITMYGECTGTTSYDAVDGRKITVPSLEGYFYK